MLTKIKKIENIATFKDFNWSLGEYLFDRFNLFYGWNGSGKSTVANIINAINSKEKRTFFQDDSKVELVFDNNTVVLTKDEGQVEANVLVYNEDFVKNTFLFESGKTSTGLQLSVQATEDQQVQLKDLNESIAKLESKKKTLTGVSEKPGDGGEIGIIKKQIEKLLQDASQEVKREMLQYKDITPLGRGSNSYYTYQKNAAKSVLENGCSDSDLEDKSTLKNILKDSQQKENLEEIFISDDNLRTLYHLLSEISQINLKEALVEQIKNLTKNQEENLFNWIKEGFYIHNLNGGTYDGATTCKFCQNQIQDKRVQELKAIFSSNIQDLFNKINKAKEIISNINIPVAPHSDKLYGGLQNDYRVAVEEYSSAKQELDNFIKEVKNNLLTKEQNPSFDFDFNQNEFTRIIKRLQEAVSAINKILYKHAKISEEFHQRREEAAHKLERLIVCRGVEKYQAFKNELRQKEEELSKCEQQLKELDNKKQEILSELTSYAVGAKKLQEKLHAFLGRQDILIDSDPDNEGSYIIKRKNNKTAIHLSEGEKNAIALVFFLVKLQEKDFDPGKTIVVIDDPVSSFDHQNLFQSYGFIKSELQKAMPAQVFIFTHNFRFFKYIQEWFNALVSDGSYGNIRKENIRIYLIKNKLFKKSHTEDAVRISLIQEAPDLLTKYQSEYLYLFDLIYTKAYLEQDQEKKSEVEQNNDMEKDYILPNAIRKFLEVYLSFRVPTATGLSLNYRFKELLKQIPDNQIEKAIRHRLDKYCQDASHSIWQESVNDLDEVLLGEMPQVCKDVVEFVKQTDSRHFEFLIQKYENQS